jgi:hypothetical protein
MDGQNPQRIPKIEPMLTKQPPNWSTWKTVAQNVFEHYDLWDIVSEQIPNPIIPELIPERAVDALVPRRNAEPIVQRVILPGNQEQVNRALEEAGDWRKRNNFAKLILTSSIDPSFLGIVTNINEVSNAWKALSEYFVPKTMDDAANTLALMTNYDATDDLDMVEWTGDMERLKSQYEEQGGVMPDGTYAALLLKNLPKSNTWNTFRQIIASGPVLSSKDIATRVRNLYIREHANDPDTLASIFSAKSNAKKRQINAVSMNDKENRTHKRARQAKDDLDSICENCKRMGHTNANCFDIGGGREGLYPKAWTMRRIEQFEKASKLRRDNDKHPGPSRTTTATRTVNSAADTTATENDSVPSIVCQCGTEENITYANIHRAFSLNEQLECWFHDSASTEHVVWNRANFTQYRTITPIVVEGFSKDMVAQALGRGTVELIATYNGSRTKLILTNVLHMPQARNNLISGVQLARAGIASHLDANGPRLLNTKTNQYFCNGTLKTFFELNVQCTPAATSNVSATNAQDTKALDEDFGTVDWDI